ncbi:MAG: hypothetical protein ACYSUQ_11095 [Planctomycetota bacterium]|jgi:hypothetical protein
MRLYEADAHLECARLHLALDEKDEPRQHFETARKMIDDMGCRRHGAAYSNTTVVILPQRCESSASG